MQEIYILFSGGVDSTIALLKTVQRDISATIYPIFFNYGQKSAKQEAETVDKIITLLRSSFTSKNINLNDCEKIDLHNSDLFKWSDSPLLNNNPRKDNPDVPNRNMILITITASIIIARRNDKKARKPTQLVVGFKNEHYDTNRKFAVDLNRLMRPLSFGVEIITPLISNSKRKSWHSLAKDVYKIKDWQKLMLETWSCYYPDSKGKQCGNCKPCQHRNGFLEETATRVRKKLNPNFRLYY